MELNRKRWPAASVLIAYIPVLIAFVVFKAIPTIRIGHMRFRFAGFRTGAGNVVPLKTILPLLMGRGNHLIATVNLMGNIIPFVPVGFLAPLVFRFISWPQALILGVIIGLAFEVMELVFRVGIFDVDDTILNGFGVALGYGLWRRARILKQDSWPH